MLNSEIDDLQNKLLTLVVKSKNKTLSHIINAVSILIGSYLLIIFIIEIIINLNASFTSIGISEKPNINFIPLIISILSYGSLIIKRINNIQDMQNKVERLISERNDTVGQINNINSDINSIKSNIK